MFRAVTITYQQILQQTFKERSRLNPSYSLRSYARDLGLAPSTLSELFNGKKGISPRKAAALIHALKLPEWQGSLFIDLVRKNHAKSPKERAAAKGRLASREVEYSSQIRKVTALKSLTSWIDLAILEVTHLKDFYESPDWIARRLGVSEAEILSAVGRLTEADLLRIEPGKGWIDASPFFTTSDGPPSEAIREFHKTVLRLGLAKLESANVTNRTVKGVIFSLKENQLPLAKQILNEAIGKIVALSESESGPKDHVLSFNAQLLTLTGE
jgi:uncharacterized protein (TIGR02147 family)